MLTKQKTILLAVVSLLAAQMCTDARAQVRELRRFALPDVAQATTDRFGRPVVLYNPAACEMLGPEMCEFVRAHEYGHIALGHVFDNTPDRVAEAEADCWAARNASPSAVRAASRYFSSGMFGTSIHGSGPQRAQRVANCVAKKRVARVRVVKRPKAATTTTRSFSSVRTPSKVVVRRVAPRKVVRRMTAPTVVRRTTTPIVVRRNTTPTAVQRTKAPTVVRSSASSQVAVRRSVQVPVKRVFVRQSR